MKAVVLAAGEGTRMRPLTLSRPKVLVPVAGAPLLDHIIDNLTEMEVSEVLLVTLYKGEAVARWAASQTRPNLAFDAITQPESPYGTGAAAEAARDWVGDEPFILHFGDIVCPRANYTRLAEERERFPEATILTTWAVEDVTGGAVFVGPDGWVRDMVEKPETAERARGSFVNAGAFVLQPECFDILATVGLTDRGGKMEKELTDVFRALIAAGRPPRAFEITGYWSNVSDLPELLRLNALMLDGLGRPDHVSLGVGAVVADGASVRDSILLDGAVVEEGAEVRYAVVDEGARVPAGSRCVGAPESPVLVANGAAA